ncbi:hypothetical protein ACQ4PT_024185 [Festuca glaucescens]
MIWCRLEKIDVPQDEHRHRRGRPSRHGHGGSATASNDGSDGERAAIWSWRREGDLAHEPLSSDKHRRAALLAAIGHRIIACSQKTDLEAARGEGRMDHQMPPPTPSVLKDLSPAAGETSAGLQSPDYSGAQPAWVRQVIGGGHTLGGRGKLPTRSRGLLASRGDCTSVGAAEGAHTSSSSVGWKPRPRGPAVPDERPPSVRRVPALEAALRGFANRKSDVIVNPTMGVVFDSLPEAYEFYNLYSWESGFGIRYGKSRQNVRGSKCMQEIVCGSAGKPVRDNSASTRTNCPALIRLLRTEDHGWFISEQRVSHNHPMLRTCAEKLHCPSHKHIDKYTMDLVKHLRENNVNLSKVYSIRYLRENNVNLPQIYVIFPQHIAEVINGMLTVDEFEKVWMILLEKYKLQNNAFMAQIYEVRHKWAKPYFSGKFCAKMTSTQRSESANHLLKGYVPPGCPMNMFVKQYIKIQFDRESEEGFQEKRTRLGGVVLRCNLPLEEHASKEYTRTMFEMFGGFVYKAGRYIAVEVLHGRKYVVRHVKSDAGERWSKTEYIVDVSADRDKFKCECGMFDHMGMICCHIIKKDQGSRSSSSFRHSALYMSALEVVQLGDRNVVAFQRAMDILLSAKTELDGLAKDDDGLGLVAKAAESQPASQGSEQLVAGSVVGHTAYGEIQVERAASPSLPGCEDVIDMDPPDRRKRKGRPTSSRDKPTYEMTGKRSRFCKICRGKGHKSTTCPQRGDLPRKPRQEPRCSNCGVAGHKKTSCCKPLQPLIVRSRLNNITK